MRKYLTIAILILFFSCTDNNIENLSDYSGKGRLSGTMNGKEFPGENNGSVIYKDICDEDLQSIRFMTFEMLENGREIMRNIFVVGPLPIRKGIYEVNKSEYEINLPAEQQCDDTLTACTFYVVDHEVPVKQYVLRDSNPLIIDIKNLNQGQKFIEGTLNSTFYEFDTTKKNDNKYPNLPDSIDLRDIKFKAVFSD